MTYFLNRTVELKEAIGIVMLAAIFSVYLHFTITRRMSRLASTLRQFNYGDRNARSHLKGDDLLARISQTLDQILDRIVYDREELLQLETRSKAVLETATEGIISIDSQGRIQSINSAAERIFGYQKRQVVGRNVSMLMPEPYSVEHDRYIRDYLRTGERKIIGIGREVSGRRSDGSVFPMELAVSELLLGDERSFTGIVRDISKRKLAEKQLKLSEEQLSLTFENAPIGIVTCDLDCQIMKANRACTQIVGYSHSELLTMRFNELVHPEDRAHCVEFTHKAKLDQMESKLIRQRWLHKNGSQVCGVLHIGVIHDDKDRPKLFVIQMEDHTQQVNAEAEARQLRDRIAHVARISTLGEMMAGIAHEINQPLAAIANYTDACQRMLSTENLDRDSLMHAMKQANVQAHRADEVIQRLRSFAKTRSLERENVDVNALIKEVISLATMETPGLQLTIKLELEERLSNVQADPIQIQQVILNLIRNGMDAMQESNAEEQNLIVRTLNDGADKIRIEVIDRGSGIDEKDAVKIFDPFYSTKLNGMGLGLSICRSIIASHQGLLDFENNPDTGATFYIRLPTALN